MPDTINVDKRRLSLWKHHLQDEADAAFLYRVLASVEEAPKPRGLYEELANVEDRHTAIWQRLLAEHGVPSTAPAPSLRARFTARVARVFGPSMLLPLLLREEGNEVRGYIALHRSSEPGSVRDSALTLAKESAHHAETLREMVGGSGEPWHRTESGGFLRNVVYGFNDGLTANFGLVAGVIGAAADVQIILVSGIAGLIADALSMGASGYLAAKSEREVYAHEIDMEREEIAMMPEVEEEELALLYEAKGVSREHARQMARDIMRDPERGLAEKVREELGIGKAHATPFKEAWHTGLATAFGALIPVAPFLFFDMRAAIWTSFAVSMLSHFGVGAARTFFTGRGVFRSGLDMFVVGLGVAAVGYLAGSMVSQWLL